MKNLLLHGQTRQSVERFLQSPSHALLLTGAFGAGKETLARSIAEKLLGTSSLSNRPYYKEVVPDGKNISIEAIRSLQSFLQLKTTGKEQIRRVALILQADLMSDEAQNALLKSLEEPPEDTVLLLASSNPDQLKDTIRSRTQIITMQSVGLKEAQDYLRPKYNEKEITWAHALSDGQTGLMVALLDTSTDHPLAVQIAIAKELYALSAFERLARVDSLVKNKEQLPELIYACKRICISAMEQAAKKNLANGVKTWHRQLALVMDAEKSLKRNPNQKLLLTDLFLQISA